MYERQIWKKYGYFLHKEIRCRIKSNYEFKLPIVRSGFEVKWLLCGRYLPSVWVFLTPINFRSLQIATHCPVILITSDINYLQLVETPQANFHKTTTLLGSLSGSDGWCLCLQCRRRECDTWVVAVPGKRKWPITSTDLP